MKFKPQTESELAESQLLPKGTYPFDVMVCSDTTKDGDILRSKKGQEMVGVKLNVHGDDGRDYHIYDYISPHFMAHKFRHFFVTIGMVKEYERGEINVRSAEQRSGWVDIGIEPAKNGYAAKNKVMDYFVKEEPSEETAPPPAPIQANGKPEDSDDVPF
jgi:hypothetical protein